MPSPDHAALDTCGPIRAPGIVPRLRPDGLEAVGYRAAAIPAAPRWTATWIWSDAAQPTTTAACFRHEPVFARAPTRFGAWISADIRYRLWLNGRLVARGPADSGQDYPGGKSGGRTGLRYADWRDLTPFAQTGVNTIAVEVFAERVSCWYGSSGRPGFFFQGEAEVGGATVAVVSDGSWRAIAAAHLVGGVVDAAREPRGWRLHGFDDGAWPRCVAAGAHWPRLEPSLTPSPLEAVWPALRVEDPTPSVDAAAPPTPQSPATIRGDGSFTLRYDRVLAAYVGIRVRGGAGATLTLAMRETPEAPPQRTQTIRLGGGEASVETAFYTSFAALTVTAADVREPIVIEDLRAIATSHPVAYRGAFTCSDPSLDRLWSVCRWATQLCTQDRYLDSPDHQEPICDPGDYLIEARLVAAAFGDDVVTRQDLLTYAALVLANDGIVFHTSYALLWLQMLIEHHEWSGDASLLRELAPAAQLIIDRFVAWRGTNGLISEAPDYMFMDWVRIAGFDCHHPPAVIGQGYLTAFFYRGLADAARVATITGDHARVAQCERLRAEIAVAFERELWDEARGRYRDGRPFQTHVAPNPWLPADVEIETHSPHVSLLAVLYDLAPRERHQRIVDAVLADAPLNVQPYFMHFVFAALDHADRFDDRAVALMRRWTIVDATRSLREMWDSGDLSHAWGATPLIQMSERILGVARATPDATTLAIAPRTCGLAWARGVVPTALGDVAVSWRRDERAWELDIDVPAGATARVVVPAAIGTVGSLVVDDAVVAAASSVAVSSGRHRIVARTAAMPAP